MATVDTAAKSESSLSFTQGLLLGQLSIILLIGAFIKFFIFGDHPSPDITAASRARERRSRTIAHKRSLLSLQSTASPHSNPLSIKKRSSASRNPAVLTSSTILTKTYYNVDSHQPESLDWFNVLIAQTIAQFRSDAQHDDAILTSLTKALNGGSRPEFLSEIKVTELTLGDEFPIFCNCRVISVADNEFSTMAGRGLERSSSSDQAGLQARMDVDLSDFITLALESKLLLNYPRPLVAVLPVALSVSVVRFSGTLSISFIPGSHHNSTPTSLAFSFLDDYRLDLSIRSLVGSRSRLQDVPKIAQLIEARLHTWFDERCVEPRFQQIELPSLWPRKKNTRGGDDVGSEPASLSRAKGKEIEKDFREEARRVVENEARATSEIERGERHSLRQRSRKGKEEYAIPGSMPDLGSISSQY